MSCERRELFAVFSSLGKATKATYKELRAHWWTCVSVYFILCQCDDNSKIFIDSTLTLSLFSRRETIRSPQCSGGFIVTHCKVLF